MLTLFFTMCFVFFNDPSALLAGRPRWETGDGCRLDSEPATFMSKKVKVKACVLAKNDKDKTSSSHCNGQ